MNTSTVPPEKWKHGRYATYSYRKCRCQLCKKAASEYIKIKDHGPYKHRSRCRCEDCVSLKNIKAREYYRSDKESAIRIGERYYILLKIQDGKCAICQRYPIKKNLLHDHDHETKLVRGLLCSKCNTGIGFLRDSPAMLQRAIDYLNDPPAAKFTGNRKYYKRGGTHQTLL